MSDEKYIPHFEDTHRDLLRLYSEAMKKNEDKEEEKVHIDRANAYLQASTAFKAGGGISSAKQRLIAEDVSNVIDTVHDGIVEINELSREQRTLTSTIQKFASDLDPKKK